MTKFLEKSFSSRAASDNYREGWEAIFGHKEVETQPELPEEESEFGINECPPAPKPHFYGPQEDGTYTMESHGGSIPSHGNNGGVPGYISRFRVYAGDIYRTLPGWDEEKLDAWTILVYADNARWRTWAMDCLLPTKRGRL
jgi:hypothetical protein